MKRPRCWPGPDCKPLTSTFVVGTAGFEPTTSASRTLRATKLRYVPKDGVYWCSRISRGGLVTSPGSTFGSGRFRYLSIACCRG
jgi:hypothetical protein